MFFIQKPTNDQLSRFLQLQREEPFSYAEVGETKFGNPSGYSFGYRRLQIGQGQSDFDRAVSALRDWQMFPEHFVELIWPTDLVEGNIVATLFRAPGFWTLNPCRMVYTVDGPLERKHRPYRAFGFAYGTVGSHLAKGEERFTVEIDSQDETVWYEVCCFSRARHWLAKAAYPYFRLQQHRFRRLSGIAMKEFVAKPPMAMHRSS